MHTVQIGLYNYTVIARLTVIFLFKSYCKKWTLRTTDIAGSCSIKLILTAIQVLKNDN